VFDQIWAGTPDKNGKTVHDQACDKAEAKISSAISSAGSGWGTNFVACNLAITGPVRAQMSGSTLTLSYWLAGNDIDLYVNTPFSCAPGHGTIFCPTDPHLTVGFDAELQVALSVPSSPCQMTAQARVLGHNTSLSGDNALGALASTGINLFGLLDIEALIDGIQPPGLNGLQGTLDQLSQACDSARGLGFTQFQASVDSRPGVLFRLIHPQAPAPGVYQASSASQSGSTPSFFHPLIAASPTQVRGGGQVTVSGSYFAPGQTGNIQIGWNDTVSTGLQESDVEWGTSSGQPSDATVKRTGPDDNNDYYNATGLTSGTSYRFRVRDCDVVTCTAWSDWATFSSGAAGSDHMLNYRDSDS
jgi:hypothetical protein